LEARKLVVMRKVVQIKKKVKDHRKNYLKKKIDKMMTLELRKHSNQVNHLEIKNYLKKKIVKMMTLKLIKY